MRPSTQYFERIKSIEYQILCKQRELERVEMIKDRATDTSIAFNEVRGSGHSDKVGKCVSAYVDLENEIHDEIAQLMREQRKALKILEQLPPDEYMVLFMTYSLHMDTNQVSDECNRSVSWVHQQRTKAMNDLDIILNPN